MPEQLIIEIRVRPNSSRNKVGGTVGNPPRDFTIVYGELGRDKRLLINGDVATLQKNMKSYKIITT